MADRLLFSKTGRARYISHLDLMRTFQRAFSRAQIPIKHTEGFNPHPFVSIALPLSVGYSSQCEILEFGLLEGTSPDEVPARLTAAMPEGIVVHQCYPVERKLKELCYVNYIMTFDYPDGRPQESEPAMEELLGRESLVVKKKSNKAKAGFTAVDLIPLIHSRHIECQSDTMTLNLVLSAQNPGLNPELIRSAFCTEYPQYTPDFVTFHRRDVLDGEGSPSGKEIRRSIMYTYRYERIQVSGFFELETQEYQEIIDQLAKEGWRYTGFVPVLQTSHGAVMKMDLIFEKEM